MIVSAREALYHISHSEQEYEWGLYSRETLRVKLEYFINVLASYDYSKAQDECRRINRKYYFSIEIED